MWSVAIYICMHWCQCILDTMVNTITSVVYTCMYVSSSPLSLYMSSLYLYWPINGVFSFLQCHAVHRTIVDQFRYALVWVRKLAVLIVCHHSTMWPFSILVGVLLISSSVQQVIWSKYEFYLFLIFNVLFGSVVCYWLLLVCACAGSEYEIQSPESWPATSYEGRRCHSNY